ncbi:MAG: hypothetical protein CVT93_09065 [Bacteroidetes bacterium HGW-Bacteroidetes-10]|nr:MAG: hypothetical protein CVT93_09065 [Bacteroidetes bacterium HGW-Bacteroidetes-10]
MIINRRILQTVAVMAILVSLLTLPAFSQEREDFRSKMEKAKQLYDKALYHASYKEITEALSQARSSSLSEYADAEALAILCAIELQMPNSEGLVSEYLNKYPYSSEKESILLRQAAYYFNLQDYVRSFEILSSINQKSLSSSQKTEFNFRLGYCHMRTGKLEEAQRLFGNVINAPFSTYTNPSKYYIAYVAYMKKDFRKAIELFSKIEGDPRFSVLASYYSLESRFMLKDYEYVTSRGEAQFKSLSGEFRTKAARILSEAFFATGNVEKANYYFEQFSFASRDLSRNDLYYSGIIAYSMKNFPQAIEAFNKLGESNDTISQNAQYHLGHSYIQTKNKQSALVAFRNASRYTFDPAIREDAMFNYAKLSFDLNSDISAFRQYLAEFSPADSKYNEIQNYIASASLLAKDYKAAIEALKMIRFPQSRDVVNLQKAAFLRGMQLIDLGAYREAVPNLELAVNNGNYNLALRDVARFWLAEAYYRDNQFSKSAELNQMLVNNTRFKQTPEYPVAMYNLGYAHFKNGNFAQAEQWFQRYISSPGGSGYIAEAKLRLGDALFMQRKYQAASEYFSQVSSSDINAYTYARYQTAVARGLMGDDAGKISVLKSLVSAGERSKLHSEVLYELGRTLVQTGDNSSAKQYFQELTGRHRESTYYPKALLELGLIALNNGSQEEAIGYYKQILDVAPQSQEAQDAIAGLENIYQERGDAEEFLTYLDNSGLSKARSTDDRELILFASAEKLYLSGNYTGALSSITSFLTRHPNSSKKAQAWFYMGDSYNKTGKPELAIDAYRKVMETGEGSFTELATLNYARLSYQLENYKQALEGYSSLMLIARLENNRVEAQLGRLNSFFMDKQWENAVAESQRIDIRNLSDTQKTRVKYIEAKSLFLTGNRSAALPLLRDLSRNKIAAEGAEATFLLISNAFDNGDFTTVEKETFAFSDSGSPQTYWLARSFILLGDTYAEKENWEQAKATYESILESYKPNEADDIADQIKMRLSKLEKR